MPQVRERERERGGGKDEILSDLEKTGIQDGGFQEAKFATSARIDRPRLLLPQTPDHSAELPDADA